MTTEVRLTPDEAASLEICPCGHNAWIQHTGFVDRSAPGCVRCDCPRTEQEASVAAVEAILTGRLAPPAAVVSMPLAAVLAGWSDGDERGWPAEFAYLRVADELALTQVPVEFSTGAQR